MWRRSLFWKLFFTYSLIILFCVAVVGGYLVQGERQASRAQLERDLAERAQLVDERLKTLLDPTDGPKADSLAKLLGHASATRITVIQPDGRVVADTEANPAQMENHKFRPEVQLGLAGKVGTDMRMSTSVRARYMYVAVPSRAHRGWVIRVAIPLSQFEERLRRTMHVLIIGAVTAAVFAILLGFFFTRRIVRPLEGMRRDLERLEEGSLGVRLDPESSSEDEIGLLARTLNRVQSRLESSIQNLTSQRNQRDTILASMVEGLLAVDSDDRILVANAAARAALGIGPEPVEGRMLVETVRIPQLVDFVEQVRAASQPLGIELVIREPRTRYLEMHGAPLHMAENGATGAVVVLNDVTRLRKLEEVRRDFVANVSHELKTPVTSIKGFLETLLDRGALEEPESARRFLGIISRQTERLADIIADLLYLSKLEYEEKQIAVQPVDLELVIEHCVANFEHGAQAGGVNLSVRIETPEHWLLGDASLLTRALDNLIDNAIKYSPSGGRVEVGLREDSGELLLQVTDQGIGIPEEHLPRISERFYRVDTARSREMGGTGLGLAIVKHVAQAHSGRLQVESRLGEGSRFTLRFPILRQGT
jgi:two-component system phosphate regulon sensor histidine kinase PhoR